MKTSKAHKRLAKIDELISDLAERYSKGALHVRAAFEGAKVAVAHLKATVTSEASTGAAKKSGSADTPKPVKRKLSMAHIQAIRRGVRRRAAETKAAGAAKTSPPTSKNSSARKSTPKKPK